MNWRRECSVVAIRPNAREMVDYRSVRDAGRVFLDRKWQHGRAWTAQIG
jgi:hypothetical protein